MTQDLPRLPLPLITKRLLIRDYVMADAQPLAAYACDPRYWQHQRPGAPTPQQIDGLLQVVIKEQTSPLRIVYFLAVMNKDTNELIGEGVLKILDFNNRQGEIGFGVAPQHWNQGFGTEIAHAMLNAAFDGFHFHRVSAQCTPDNSGSVRILEKLGMTREALLRDVHLVRDKWWSTAIYGVLDQEYAKMKTLITSRS